MSTIDKNGSQRTYKCNSTAVFLGSTSSSTTLLHDDAVTKAKERGERHYAKVPGYATRTVRAGRQLDYERLTASRSGVL
jgi:hypothetical protein